MADMPENFKVYTSEIKAWAKTFHDKSEEKTLDAGKPEDVQAYKMMVTVAFLLYSFAEQMQSDEVAIDDGEPEVMN
jgi:hypothetical protein